MFSIYDPKTPNEHSLQRSDLLMKLIKNMIALSTNNAISFAAFMDNVLYHPQWGYYNADEFTIGKNGDFITAPELTPFFAICFSKQILKLCDKSGLSTILEIGAGTGRFACDLIKDLKKYSAIPERYYIYELSISLRKKQQAFLQKNLPEEFSKFVWLDKLPQDFVGIIIANEVLDAIPCHCFSIKNHIIKERAVTVLKNKFAWKNIIPDKPLFEKINLLYKNYQLNDYESEININILSFVKQISSLLKKGVILFCDYGYGQEELYHPKRIKGTLACFYQHRIHEDPFTLIGLQDITSYVDFTNVIDVAADSGCDLEGYTTQAAFLLGNGLAELSNKQQHKDVKTTLEHRQAIKYLTLPTEMGERVKCMALSKNISINDAFKAFQLLDKRNEL